MTHDWFRDKPTEKPQPGQASTSGNETDTTPTKEHTPTSSSSALAADPWGHIPQRGTSEKPVEHTTAMPSVDTPLVGPDSPPPARGWVAGSTAGNSPAGAQPAGGVGGKARWEASPALTQGSPVPGMRPLKTPKQFRQAGPATPSSGSASGSASPPRTVSTAQTLARSLVSRVPRVRLKPVRRTRRLIRLILLIPVLYLLFYLFLGAWVWQNFNRIDAISDYEARPRNTMGQTWLLVGSDSRETLSKDQRQELSTGAGQGGMLTDSMLLLHAPLIGSPTLVSLPRDSWLAIPATTVEGKKIAASKRKLNSVYARGGPSLLVQTVEQNTGVHIDHYLEVGMLGVVELTNAVGGVEVTIPYRMKDHNSGTDFQKGPRTLNGIEALAFVRDRHSNPARQDLARIENQQTFIKGLMSEIVSPATAVQPWRAWRVANAGVDSLHVDKASTPFTLLQVARALRSVASGNGTTTTVPISNPAYETSTGENAVLWDTNAAQQLFATMG